MTTADATDAALAAAADILLDCAWVSAVMRQHPGGLAVRTDRHERVTMAYDADSNEWCAQGWDRDDFVRTVRADDPWTAFCEALGLVP